MGLEATGYSRRFERLRAELRIQVWIGDAAEIKTKRVRKQKRDREDARLLLRLLQEKNFPRIWVHHPENPDLKDERSWKGFRWAAERHGVERICWSCWTG